MITECTNSVPVIRPKISYVLSSVFEDVPFDTDDWAAWTREQCNQMKSITTMERLGAWRNSTARTRSDLKEANVDQWNILAKEYTEIHQKLNTGERDG